MIRLALLRHGHTSWNRAGRIQGRTDIPLDTEAHSQLSVQRLPPPWDQATLYASPLKRAAQTARLVGQAEPITDPALIEMDWGNWEGLHGKELLADPSTGYRHIEDWGWSYTPPGGESPADLRARLIPWAERLSGDCVAVCHIGVMRVLMAHATGWDFDGKAPFEIKRNRLYTLHINGSRWHADSETIRLVPVPA